ncbi:hypothetical protein SAMN05444695_109185 [Rhodococcus triatomae]|uniref:Uncharacterized protein n=1 Tax=Rhodococcus triatomae TaxID=300028 RepID=A0A1G8MDL6_9NOCA|nr:DUF5691 domain-containing protein [Rhodococcus triatomae]SDI65965.1 hypothetical protein SAMN05444695_109185 [Rhodococcus triatomae]
MTDAAEPDRRPTLPDSAAEHLLELLATKSWTLPEWFAAASRFRASDDLIPRLLDVVPSYPAYREELLDLAGSRGRDAAAERPEWASLRRFRGDAAWSSDSFDERLRWLQDRRRTDPADAATHLAARWHAENTHDRTAFLRALGTGLGSHDIALLESALDDPLREVRLLAVQLLRKLPDSPFAERMAARARAWVRLERKPLRSRLVVNVPASLDRSAQRDGIETAQFKNKGIRRWWLRMVVVATPLAVWEDVLGSAERAWEIRIEDTWRSLMWEAWTSATVLQRDARWAGALLEARGRETPRNVVALAPSRQRIHDIGSGRADGYLLDVDGQALLDGLPHPWPEPVVAKVVELLVRTAELHADSGRSLGPLSRHSHHTTLRRVEAHFPFSAVPMLEAVAESTRDTEWARAFGDAARGIERRRLLLDELR